MTSNAPIPEESSTVVEATTISKPQRLPVTVTKATPYTFDLGNLLASDPNPITSTSEETLRETARDGAQALINQLLTTCSIRSTPAGVLLSLPAPDTPLPREKPVPVAKPPTKWQQFAARKGIEPKKKTGKTVYDEATGEWVPKWGYQGANKKGEGEWLVEVDDDKTPARDQPADGSAAVRSMPRRERKERVRRNERRSRANDRRQKSNK